MALGLLLAAIIILSAEVYIEHITIEKGKTNQPATGYIVLSEWGSAGPQLPAGTVWQANISAKVKGGSIFTYSVSTADVNYTVSGLSFGIYNVMYSSVSSTFDGKPAINLNEYPNENTGIYLGNVTTQSRPGYSNNPVGFFAPVVYTVKIV